jgi:hypothetical protein
MRLVFCSVILMAMAFEPSIISGLLSAVGMDDRAARIAGSRLTVMAAMVGAGFLLIGLSSWARNTRMHNISQGHMNMLDHLVREYGGTVDVLPGLGAGFSGEIGGIHVEIVVEPIRGGQAWIRARCPASRPLHISPRGLAPESENGAVVACGRSWEAWSSVAGPLQHGAEQCLEDAFDRGGLLEMKHGRTGIELSMPNAPGEGLLARISLGLEAAAAVSRINR